MSTPKVLGTIFFNRTMTVAAFELCLVSERIFKKKVTGEIAFDLISLFHVQINTRAYKKFNYHDSICLSCKIL